MSQSFPLAVVLGTYHDRLLCPWAEYRAFLDYMCGERVWLHDVARARRIVAGHLSRKKSAMGIATTVFDMMPPPEKTDSGAGSRYVKAVAKAVLFDRVTLMPMPKGSFKATTADQAFV